MKSNILEAVINLVRNQAVAMVVCFLMWVEALCTAQTNRLWRDVGANMTHVFGGNFTEITVTSFIVCALLAAKSPLTNLACHKSSRCVFASVYLPRVEGEQTEGFTCWFSQVCMYEGTYLKENETVPEPMCPELQNLQCSKYGMVLQDAAASRRRTTCSAPFEQLPFGCMYDSDFKGTYCETLQHCQELGANLASPETEEDSAAMKAYYDNKHDQGVWRRFIGLFKADGVWRWPANQREAAPAGTGEWGPEQPEGDANFGIMFIPDESDNEAYMFGDGVEGTDGKPICHVWPAK